MHRTRQLETLQAATRDRLPDVAAVWLAAVREEMEKLSTAAIAGELTDAEFIALVEATSAKLPELLTTMDHDALAGLMEQSMGAAMANGIEERLKTARPKTQDEEAPPPPSSSASSLAS